MPHTRYCKPPGVSAAAAPYFCEDTTASSGQSCSVPLELAAAGLRGEAGAAEQFFDMLPTKGSPVEAARIKLSLVLQGAAATGSQPAQSVRSSFALKAPGFLGGPRTLIYI